jgi:hypothetical protein
MKPIALWGILINGLCFYCPAAIVIIPSSHCCYFPAAQAFILLSNTPSGKLPSLSTWL